jgi:hypothetical protein
MSTGHSRWAEQASSDARILAKGRATGRRVERDAKPAERPSFERKGPASPVDALNQD